MVTIALQPYSPNSPTVMPCAVKRGFPRFCSGRRSFRGASGIELHFLESEIIQRLISQVRALGFSGAELTEWIPVYGVLYGVLNVKRELRALEFGKLKQAIYALENEIRDVPDETRSILVPRLINHYFWLIDHYVNVNDDKARINEVLLKIKLLDTDVYNRYTM